MSTNLQTSPRQFVSPPLKRGKRWKGWLLRIVIVLAGSYFGVFALLMMIERHLIFHPTKASQDWAPAPASIRARDVELTISKGVRIHAWWCEPEGWTPDQGAMLYCHGNAGNLSHRGAHARTWQEKMGVAVMMFDYPGYGKSTGKPSEKSCYEAGEAAWQWIVSKKNVDPGKVILLGGSLGGGVAVELGTRHPFRLLVLISAFTSVPDMAAKLYPWLPARPLIRNRFENRKKIARCSGPAFIAHGTADKLIPFTMGQKLYAAASEPKRFYPLVGHGHNDPPEAEFFGELKRFLAEVETRPLEKESTIR